MEETEAEAEIIRWTLLFGLWVLLKWLLIKQDWETTRQRRGLITFPCEKERTKTIGLIRV